MGRYRSKEDETFEPEIDPKYSGDWTPVDEKAGLKKLFGHDVSWAHRMADDVRRMIRYKLEYRESPDCLEDTLLTVRGHTPLMLPVNNNVSWGEMEQNFCFQYLTKYGDGCTVWGDGCYVNEDDVGYVGSCFRENLGKGMRAGSVDKNGDSLSVTPSVYRGVKPANEDIVFGLMIGQAEAGSTHLSMTRDFLLNKLFPHLRGKNYSTPFDFAYDCIRYIKGYILMMVNRGNDALFPFSWAEDVAKEIAGLVGNPAPDRLKKPREYDLSDGRRNAFYDKALSVFGKNNKNSEIVIFLMDNSNSLSDPSVLDDPEVVTLMKNIPNWVKNGFVIDRATDLYRACRSGGDRRVDALKVCLRICGNIYGDSGERTWWFKEDEDLVRFFDLKRQDVSVQNGKLSIGVCEEGFDLVSELSATSSGYFVHTCDLYKEAGYRVVDEGGISRSEAVAITADVAKWYGVYNVARGVRVIEQLLHILSQPVSSKSDAVNLFRSHLERYKPESPFIAKMEADATLQMPGLNLLFGVAEGKNVSDQGKDEFTLAGSDFLRIEDFLRKPLPDRAVSKNLLLSDRHEARRQLMLTSNTSNLMLEGPVASDEPKDGTLLRYMRFDRQLHDEAGFMSREVSAVYFHLFAQKMTDPLDPPKGLIKALLNLSKIRMPMKVVSVRRWGGGGSVHFERDDDANLHGFSNEDLRYLGLVALFDARIMGLVSDEQVAKVLDMVAVERPKYDKDWAEVDRLKGEEALQKSYLGVDDHEYREVAHHSDNISDVADDILNNARRDSAKWFRFYEDERRFWEMPEEELAKNDGMYAQRVLRMRRNGYTLEDVERVLSIGELEAVRDTTHSYLRMNRDGVVVENDVTRPDRFTAQSILKLLKEHQEAVNSVCRARADGFRDDGNDSGFYCGGKYSSYKFVEEVWGKGKIRSLYRLAKAKDEAHEHRLYDVMGPLADVGVGLTDAMNLVRMGVLTVSDLRCFAESQIDGLLEVGAIRYKSVTKKEVTQRGKVGDEARKYDFKEPIDPKKIDAMIARGVLNIGAFREIIRDSKDVAKTTNILSYVVKLEALYLEVLKSADKALASVSGMLDRSWVGFSPITARDNFIDGVRAAREKFTQEVDRCQAEVMASDPDIVRFLNFSALGDQLARFEEAVIRWFAKMVPKDIDTAGAVIPAVAMLYSASGGSAQRNIGSLDRARYGRGYSEEKPHIEVMRQLSDDMLDITSRLLAYTWMLDPRTGDSLVSNVQRVLALEANAGADSTALAIRGQVGGLSILGVEAAKSLELLLPRAREIIINARKQSAYLITLGGKIHTTVPVDPRYFELVKALLGLSNSPFRLASGHDNKTLILPPVSSPLEVALLLNCLVLLGAIPLKAADVRQTGGGGSLPDAQICLPTGRLSEENCAFLGSCVLLATDDGVSEYPLDAFMSNNSGDETGARMMIHDGGAANLPLPFIYGMKTGRVDTLGRRSVLDINNLQLLGTVLSHSQFGGPFGKFAEPFKAKYYAILQKYNISHVLDGSWVHDRRASYTKQEQIAHLKCVNDCCGAWSKHRFLINDAFDKGIRPPDGIIYDVTRLLDELRQAVDNEVRVLHARGDFRDELDILLVGQELYLPAA